MNTAYGDQNPGLRPGERVLGFEFGDRPRAYPIEVLQWFETVEDRVADTPILVTYCPLCGAGVVFERRLANETLTLYHRGEVWHNDRVLYENETKSRFSQILGEGIRELAKR